MTCLGVKAIVNGLILSSSASVVSASTCLIDASFDANDPQGFVSEIPGGLGVGSQPRRGRFLPLVSRRKGLYRVCFRLFFPGGQVPQGASNIVVTFQNDDNIFQPLQEGGCLTYALDMGAPIPIAAEPSFQGAPNAQVVGNIDAWVGHSDPFVTSMTLLDGLDVSGHSVKLAWVCVTRAALVEAVGWRVDNVQSSVDLAGVTLDVQPYPARFPGQPSGHYVRPGTTGPMDDRYAHPCSWVDVALAAKSGDLWILATEDGDRLARRPQAERVSSGRGSRPAAGASEDGNRTAQRPPAERRTPGRVSVRPTGRLRAGTSATTGRRATVSPPPGLVV